MSAARRMKAPVAKVALRVKKAQPNTPDEAPLPCALARKGCKHNRTQHSIFCYAHGRRIDAWAGKPETLRKKRLQDLDRWKAFHNYTNVKGAS